MTVQILRIRDVCEKVGVSKGQIYKLIRSSGFPRPISLGSQAVGWVESQIDEWLLDQADGG